MNKRRPTDRTTGIETVVIILVATLATIITAWLLAYFLSRWFAVHTSQQLGVSSSASRSYNWWSGSGSVLVPLLFDVSLWAGLVALYMHIKCVECIRPRRHVTSDTAQGFCHHHFTKEHVEKHRAIHKVLYPNHIAHIEPPVDPAVTEVVEIKEPVKEPAKPRAKASASRADSTRSGSTTSKSATRQPAKKSQRPRPDGAKSTRKTSPSSRAT